MKIQVLDNTFYRRPYITKPLDYITFQTTSNAYFDKDGYELNKLEQEFYKINGINIGLDQQYHKACQIEWFLMDLEGFGACTNTGACEAQCPKGISVKNIARMNREYIMANVKK